MKKGRGPSFVSKVRRTIVHRGMIKPGETILVACSGGADSTALLHVLYELRTDFALKPAVAHFDHGLRAASAKDARFVHEMAADLGLPFYLQRQDVGAEAKKGGLNLEETGRRLRYEFLQETAAEIGARRIATGHSLDDQAETVLMRLLRGSGSRGLSGIAPILEYAVIRPLIDVRRKEIEAFLRERKISWREDESNRDLRFLRNAVRRRLIPHLEKKYEPAIVEKLGRTADLLAADEQSLELHVGRLLPGIVKGEGKKAALSVDALSLLPLGLSRRAIRDFLELHQKGDLLRITFDDIENIRNLGPGKVAVIPGGIRLVRESSWIGRAPVPIKKRAAAFSCAWDGKTLLKFGSKDAAFSGRTIPNGQVFPEPFDDVCRAYLDADRLVFPLVVRLLRPGDRYRPLGTAGRQKLTEALRAKGVPVRERSRKAVFVSGDEIAWVEGLPVAETFKVRPSTCRIFMIEKQIKGEKS